MAVSKEEARSLSTEEQNFLREIARYESSNHDAVPEVFAKLRTFSEMRRYNQWKATPEYARLKGQQPSFTEALDAWVSKEFRVKWTQNPTLRAFTSWIPIIDETPRNDFGKKISKIEKIERDRREAAIRDEAAALAKAEADRAKARAESQNKVLGAQVNEAKRVEESREEEAVQFRQKQDLAERKAVAEISKATLTAPVRDELKKLINECVVHAQKLEARVNKAVVDAKEKAERDGKNPADVLAIVHDAARAEVEKDPLDAMIDKSKVDKKIPEELIEALKVFGDKRAFADRISTGRIERLANLAQGLEGKALDEKVAADGQVQADRERKIAEERDRKDAEDRKALEDKAREAEAKRAAEEALRKAAEAKAKADADAKAQADRERDAANRDRDAARQAEQTAEAKRAAEEAARKLADQKLADEEKLRREREKDLKEREKDLKAEQDKVRGLTDDKTRLEQEVKRLTDENSRLDKDLKAAQAKIGPMQADIAKGLDVIKEREKTIQKLQDDLEKERKARVAADAAAAAEKNNVGVERKAKEAAQAGLANVQGQFANEQAKVASLTAQLEAERKALAAKQAELDAKKKELVDLEASKQVIMQTQLTQKGRLEQALKDQKDLLVKLAHNNIDPNKLRP